MQDYFQTVWSINRGIDPITMLQDYPEELRGDVCLHLHKEVLGLPIFEASREGCRKAISLRIKTFFCAPDLLYLFTIINYNYTCIPKTDFFDIITFSIEVSLLKK